MNNTYKLDTTFNKAIILLTLTLISGQLSYT